MRGNPYYVEPANVMPGLQNLFQGIGNRAELMKAESKEKEKMAVRQKVARLMQMGDLDGVREESIKNPWVAEDVSKSMGVEWELMVSMARKVKLGQLTGSQALIEGAEETIKKGGNAKPLMDMAQKAQMEPDKDMAAADMILAMNGDTIEPPKDTRTEKIQNFEYYQKLLKDDPLGAANFSKVTGSEYSPSPLKKLIGELELFKKDGADPAIIKAYEDEIFGNPVDVNNITQDEIDTLAAMFILTGKMPSLGRGKESTRVRVAIAKSAAQEALGSKNFGEEDTEPDKTPAQAALDTIGSQADTKAIQSSMNFLDKQLSSMGSFVANLEMQVDKVSELSKDLKTFDTRLLNIPLRIMRGKIAGSPLQAKYDMYLSEIESEIGKLATGATGSVAELSASAQEKWAKIHDKNLSVKDMLSLLEETKEAARMRRQSVQIQLDLTRERMRTPGRNFSNVAPPEAIEYLKQNPQLSEQFKQKYGYLPEGF